MWTDRVRRTLRNERLTTEHSHREILEMLQASTKPPIIAEDRSVKPYRAQGTFAWVLADQDGNPWLRCRGPVSGTPIDSFRSKAHVVRTSVSEFVGGPFYG
jgi:hypothetical protein